MAPWEETIRKHLEETLSQEPPDPAHDLAHFQRVVATSKQIAEKENADLRVVIPAAWLHDLVNVPKNDPRRSQASRLSAEEACRYLEKIGYGAQWGNGEKARILKEIAHAIEAHSYSAGIETRSLEARVVQDADRLDGLGAIGIARVFAVAGLLKRPLYHSQDPFAKSRTLNDYESTVDHFFVKLFKTVDTLKTPAGKEEGQRRSAIMRRYLDDLSREIS
ncbi:MAG: HD domain-containing protein [Bdellovibrionales bacterium]|nr:HD domain-containing protein [Bdellovibrionales bacterium]